ncbi:tol-pal system protein YbgF [Phenylobacterium immobile]|uniref:tol-pal system protein YbgF n=1 Tax=Phenylobacterium immobile TaxID=21 RepID=UPI000A9BCEDC|nr:tol-pal system protein YbgF [Phenylobacterium immobile]
MRAPASLRRFGPTTVAIACLLIAIPAASQTSLDDPLDARDAKRLDRMEKVMRELRAIVFQSQRQSGVPIVVQPADTDARLQGISDRLGDLEQTLTRLNGTMEALTRDLDLTRRDNVALKAQVADLATRLTALEASGAPAPAAGDAYGAPPAPPPGVDPAEAFSAARQLMLNGDYDGAERAFAAYVADYPDGPRTPEARYWLGKTLTVRGEDTAAAGAYIGAIRGWPQTAWAPDATVELARALVALRKPADACQTLGELGRRYPKAPVAVKNRAAATAAQARCG